MQTIDWLKRLVAFDTISDRSNLELISDIQNALQAQGINTRLTRDPNAPKANLAASIPDQHGNIEGGIVLSGHTDVVPVTGQAWLGDPFTAIVQADRVIGRGTCDMKGFIAVVLALTPWLLQQQLPQPVHFAFSYDEEVGCKGAPLLLADWQQIGLHPQACIVGEPTNMQLVSAHKGISAYRCKLHGKAIHSSLTPKGCNAIEYAAKLILALHQYAERFKTHGPFDQYFDVPFTSLSVNRIMGGIATNIIPNTCEFIFEMRHLPQLVLSELQQQIKDIVNEIQDEMRIKFAEAKIDFEILAAAPGFETTAQHFIKEVESILGLHEIKKVAYATEAGLFQQANIPTILCGPGSIEQAHTANEYVLIEQLEKCEQFLKTLLLKHLR
jgi:acetylornithine deacetylase